MDFPLTDITALRRLLPPLPKETWEEYLKRALSAELITEDEISFISETYGSYALKKIVEPLTKEQN